MHREFVRGTQRYKLKDGFDNNNLNETTVVFENNLKIHTFIQSAIRDHRKQSFFYNRSEKLYSDIRTGKKRIVLTHKTLEDSQPKDNLFKDAFVNLVDAAKRYKVQLEKIYSRILHADYNILETVYQFDENSNSNLIAPMVVDISSIKSHSSGWKSLDDPFEIASLGALKSLAGFHLASFLKLGNYAIVAAGLGGTTELISGQYLVTGKSVNCRKWYGSYAIHYNIKTGHWEIPWVKYKKSGPNQRILIELKRKDRIMVHNRPTYNHPELLVPPFQPMDKFIADYKNNNPLPEHNVTKPIRI